MGHAAQSCPAPNDNRAFDDVDCCAFAGLIAAEDNGVGINDLASRFLRENLKLAISSMGNNLDGYFSVQVFVSNGNDDLFAHLESVCENGLPTDD